MGLLGNILNNKKTNQNQFQGLPTSRRTRNNHRFSRKTQLFSNHHDFFQNQNLVQNQFSELDYPAFSSELRYQQYSPYSSFSQKPVNQFLPNEQLSNLYADFNPDMNYYDQYATTNMGNPYQATNPHQYVATYPNSTVYHNMTNSVSQSQIQYQKNPFSNPLQLEENFNPNPFNQHNNYYLTPQQNPMLPQAKSSTFGNVLNQFKTQSGSIDFNKMMGTASQMMSAVNQVSGLVKGVGGLIKSGIKP